MTTIVSHSRYITRWVIGTHRAHRQRAARRPRPVKFKNGTNTSGIRRMLAAKLLLFDGGARFVLPCYWISDALELRCRFVVSTRESSLPTNATKTLLLLSSTLFFQEFSFCFIKLLPYVELSVKIERNSAELSFNNKELFFLPPNY